MKVATKAKAARVAPAASQVTLPDKPNDNAELALAQAGKFVAVLAYCHGAASLSATDAKFEQHPEWRAV